MSITWPFYDKLWRRMKEREQAWKDRHASAPHAIPPLPRGEEMRPAAEPILHGEFRYDPGQDKLFIGNGTEKPTIIDTSKLSAAVTPEPITDPVPPAAPDPGFRERTIVLSVVKPPCTRFFKVWARSDDEAFGLVYRSMASSKVEVMGWYIRPEEHFEYVPMEDRDLTQPHILAHTPNALDKKD